MTEPIIIKNWELGIADSPHKGLGLMRNVDIDSFPGAVKTVKKPGTYFHSITTRTFTADAASNVCTASDTLEANGVNFGGAAVYFTTTTTLPAGLSTNTIYFLIYVSATTFKVATSYKNSVGSSAGTAIDITDAGTGTHTINQIAIGTINWVLQEPRLSYYYMLSSNGRTWFVPSGTTAYLLNHASIDTAASGLTNASGQGMALSSFSSTTGTWLFVFRNAKIDILNIYSTTEIEAVSWTDEWASDMNSTAGSGNSHHAINGQDNIIYYCDDRWIGSIKEVTTFDPANGATYTHSTQALDLPPREIAQCLEELGVNLLIGGNTFNIIYPWDRISDSYNLPLQVPEYGIKRMKNLGSVVYILAGTWGNIYATQGSYVRHFRKLPIYLTNNAGTIQSNPITWGGIAAANGTILFGVTTVTSGNAGVWRLYTDGRLIIDNVPSSGSANVIGLWAQNDFYIMGYSGGADNFSSNVSSTKLYDNYETVIHSGLYQVATKLEKGTFSRLEVVLAKPATLGNVRVGYREDMSSSFTTLDTFTCDAAAVTFTSESIGLIDIDKIQLQVEMNDGVGAVDVELVEVRLLP